MINYAKLFRFSLLLLLVIITLRWFGGSTQHIVSLLPSAQHSASYNYAVFGLVVIGIWGLARIIRQKRKKGSR